MELMKRTKQDVEKIMKKEIAELSTVYLREKHKDDTLVIEPKHIRINWSCKTLHHTKAILYSEHGDEKLYECTYNGINDEIYVDVYDKIDVLYSDEKVDDIRETLHNMIADYANTKDDKAPITPFDVYEVWEYDIYDNYYGMLSTCRPDGMYYECGFNLPYQQVSIGAYEKILNRCISW